MDSLQSYLRNLKSSRHDLTVEEEMNSTDLHEFLGEKELSKLYHIFQKIPEGKATAEQLRKILEEFAGCYYTDSEFDVLFAKINSNRNDVVTWDEFVSYLLLGFQNNDPSNQKETMQQPITGHPVVINSQHRLPVIRIQYCPTVMPDRTTSYSEGSYITCSRDGTCNWWTLDMEKHRSAKSKNIQPRVHPTWILDMVCLPDLNILCTSASEGELRFYDTTARNFTIRVVICSLPSPISAMFYRFYESLDSENTLVTGDTSGALRIFLFSPVMRGPFQNSPGKSLQVVRYETLAKGDFKGMRVLAFPNVHVDCVRQVGLYEPLHCFISCCEVPAGPSLGPPGVSISDVMGVKPPYQFRMPRGATVFTFDDVSHILVTGGLDCIIRLWNVFVPSKPNTLLSGHHAGIIMLILQNEKLYSMSKDKVIKVWDVPAQAIMQTYITLCADMGTEHCPITTLYNPFTRELMVGGMRIATLLLDPLLNETATDGYTHTKAVSVCLYNNLFKYIITCGLDSCIITWDPWIGKRICLVKGAHTTVVHGETIDVEITAATFDPNKHMLLTGARNGTLKVWNFNTGICLRNMSIEDMCEVTAVFWIPGRLLAMGWNRHVTEFADEVAAAGSKGWELRHAEDVLCAATRSGQALATSSYSGELIFWHLETGQAYRRYNVVNPHGRIKLVYMPPEVTMSMVSEAGLSKRGTRAQTASSISKRVSAGDERRAKGSFSAYKRISVIGYDKGPETMTGAKDIQDKKRRNRKISVVKLPKATQHHKTLSIHAMIFLEARPMHPDIGSMLLSVEDGRIQMWSHHPMGGFKIDFAAIHSAGDYIASMTTDPDNDFLFTGTTTGYLKIWLMTNYGYFNKEKAPKEVSVPLLRLWFPFLWRDRLEGRAKRSIRSQPLPMLLNCFKAHKSTLLSCQYMPEHHIIITSSSDLSVRLWSISGRYINTLGTSKPWEPIPNVGPIPLNFPYRLPPDIKRCGSFTTLKVLLGGETASDMPLKSSTIRSKAVQKKQDEVVKRRIYGKALSEPILGNHFQLPKRGELRNKPILDTSLSYIPVYSHLDVHALRDRIRPPTPDAIKKWRNRNKESIAASQEHGDDLKVEEESDNESVKE